MIYVRQILYAVRSSFWFTPAVIVVGMILLACGMIALEGVLEARILSYQRLHHAWEARAVRELHEEGAEGVRARVETRTQKLNGRV